MNVFHILAQFDSVEISDALDSLHIERMLLGIQPLLPGMNVVESNTSLIMGSLG